MGEWHPATEAYMIYTNEDGVMEGDPAKPTIPSIYKIPVNQVEAFKRKFNVAGAKWVAVYHMHDWMDSIVLAKDSQMKVLVPGKGEGDG